MAGGLFVNVEGCEGSGKTSIIEYLKNTLPNKYSTYKFDFTREPGGTIISEKIREILLDKNHIEMNKLTEAYLYAASRAQHVAQRIIPNLQKGIFVFTDRFIDTNICYQGFAHGIGPEYIYQTNMKVVKDAIPDLTIYIDVHPSVALLRRISTGSANRPDNEVLSFHVDAYNGFHQLYNITDTDYIMNKKEKSQDNVFNPFMKKHSYHGKDVLVVCGNQPLRNVIKDVEFSVVQFINNWLD